jgi:ferredoxin
MGIHRNVIHPRFGNFILLGTVLVDTPISEYNHPLDYNPCLECKLCVSACPVGAIGSDGVFNFSACYTHNYREFLGGFTNWVETIAASHDASAYRRKVSDSESASMWQSLSFGANYKAAYCMAVCPAGEDVIGPFLEDRKSYLDDVVRPLQDKSETVYVVGGSDAEEHVAKRFPNKKTKRVGNNLNHMTSVQNFLRGLPLVFQRGQSKGIDATYHFIFTGREERKATVVIREQKVEISEGHVGNRNILVTADTATWLGFISRERNLLWAILRRKIRIRGAARLLLAFGRCFPS